jgi:hypothetical protein
MLCGAADTRNVLEHFERVVRDVGGQPMTYLQGAITYSNAVGARFEANSRASVLDADICVFVVVEDYGDLTWRTELDTALQAGTPFLVLCLDATYAKYRILNELRSLDGVTDPSDRRMTQVLRSLEYDWQLTVAPFTPATFEQKIREQLGGLFEAGMRLVQQRNVRTALRLTVADADKLSASDVQRLVELATDELEDKGPRKRAIRLLADRGGLDEDDVFALLESSEQGVQRLAFDTLPRLVRAPVGDEFLIRAVEVANNADDVGIPRRLVPALVQLDRAGAVRAFEHLTLAEEGTRRRLAMALIAVEEAIREAELNDVARRLLDRCLSVSAEQDWKTAAREMRDRLAASR